MKSGFKIVISIALANGFLVMKGSNNRVLPFIITEKHA
jgi:hypothetical protein